MRVPWPTTPAALRERPEVWYDARRGLHLCEAVGVIAAAASAVGHRLLIGGPADSSRVSHGAIAVDCFGPEASLAVSGLRLAAGAGSPTVAPSTAPSPMPN